MKKDAVFLLILFVVVSVSGQLNLKLGMQAVHALQPSDTLSLLWCAASQARVILGLTCFVGSTLLWLLVLSRVDLSLAHPTAGISHIVMALASWGILGEALSPMRWSGTLIIILGAFVISRS